MNYQISKNFSYKELTLSTTAKRLGIDNTPGITVEERLHTLCRKILQPLRDAWGEPIIVGSGYRCLRLNEAVGGVKNSDHIYGCAADIHALGDNPKDNRRLFDLAVEMMNDGRLMDVKQIIDEYNYNWIHIAYQNGRTSKRNQVLHVR